MILLFDTIKLKLHPKYHNPIVSIKTLKKLYPFNEVIYDSNLSWNKVLSFIKTNINLVIYSHLKVNDSSEATISLYDERIKINNPQISYKFNIVFIYKYIKITLIIIIYLL